MPDLFQLSYYNVLTVLGNPIKFGQHLYNLDGVVARSLPLPLSVSMLPQNGPPQSGCTEGGPVIPGFSLPARLSIIVTGAQHNNMG